MRLVFMGSPESVLGPLRTLLSEGPKAGHSVVAVVSQPKKPVGRKGEPVDPPVARFAKANGLVTLQPERAGAADFLATLRELAPDVVITAAYGQILTDEFLAVPRRATINVHPSLLPSYRGAIPVPAALLDGMKTSGVTILFTVKQLDAGNVILQRASPIAPDETTETLTRRYFDLGGEMLLDALAKLNDKSFIGVPQDASLVTHCLKIKKTDGQVDWTFPVAKIVNRYRAFEPWPGSYTFWQGKRLGLAGLSQREGRSGPPGSVAFDKSLNAVIVSAGDGSVVIKQVKPAGGKDMQASAFWNGVKDKAAVTFSREEG